MTNNVTLLADITDCVDHGIEIGKSGLTIDLNGFTLDGDDDAEEAGIFIDGFNNTKIVGPGTIQQFGTGIHGIDTNGTSVRNATITDNADPLTGGVVLTRTDLGKKNLTDGVTVSDNTITLNEGSGILIHRSNKGAKITGNTVTGNEGDGVFLGGAGERRDLDDVCFPDCGDSDGPRESVAVSGAKIDDNDITSNMGSAVAVTGEPIKGVSVTNNDLSGNGADDNGTPAAGHEHREFDDQTAHGVKIAGDMRDITITGNDANANGPGTLCNDRNGAGIFVAGKGSGIKINDNETDDNAMAGIFTAGELKNVSIQNSPSNTGNNLNCEDDEAGIMMTGEQRNVKVIGNGDVSNNGASGIMFEGHAKVLTIENNNASDNVGAGGGGFVDTAGIMVHGRAIKLRILNNTANNNSNSSATTGHGIDVRGSLGGLRDTVLTEALFKGNTTNGNEGWGTGVFVQASQPCVGAPDGPDADGDPDCKSVSEREPQPETADNDCDVDKNDDPFIGSCPDKTANKTRNVVLSGNTSSSNGLDGFFVITDATFTGNTADTNGDDGIEHEDDPTVPPRSADAEDGPHLLKDGGGNTATGNTDTNCSAGLSC